MQRTRTRNLGVSSSSPSWLNVIKQLDFYYKPDSEAGLLKRSKWGGVMTLTCAFILTFLVISEVVEYVSVGTVDVLTVDTRRGVLLPIFMDIYFPSLPCWDIAMDVVEASSGETLEEAAHQIQKRRIAADGKLLTEGIQKELGSAAEKSAECISCMPSDIPRTLTRFVRQRADKRACCSDCNEVRAYLQKYHLPQSLTAHAPQCAIEKEMSDDEGCKVYGFLEVPRGKGDFHIAAGMGFEQSHETHSHHMHQLDWTRVHKFNITHTVNYLSFGPAIPKMINPLDKHSILAPVLAQHMYMIQVVPTQYDNGGTSLFTNQYTFTQHHLRIDIDSGSFALPGVYFKYEINPLMIHVHDKDSSFATFLTRICAIIGGLYVVFGILYSLTYTVVKSTKKQRS